MTLLNNITVEASDCGKVADNWLHPLGLQNNCAWKV